MPKPLRSNKPAFTAFLFFSLVAALKSQSDTIYRRDGSRLSATVTEIGEDYIIYKTGTGATVKLPAAQLQKVRLKDGSTETFKAKAVTEKPKESDRDQIERLGVDVGKRFVSCAIEDLMFSSPEIDWSSTQGDYFNPGHTIIVVKVTYQRDKELNEAQWFIFHINLDDKSGDYTCSFKNSSSYKDQPFFVKCQRKIRKIAEK